MEQILSYISDCQWVSKLVLPFSNNLLIVLGLIPHHHPIICIMDDCLVHLKFVDPLQDFKNLFQSLKDNGLKSSPHKCQFFRTSLVYMDFQFLIQNGRPSFTPNKDKCDAIQNLEPPKTVCDCRKICGMVNF